MKRLQFTAPDELVGYCRQAGVTLVVEYRDESGRQRQVTLAGDELEQAPRLLSQPEAAAYFRLDGWFYEVVVDWARS